MPELSIGVPVEATLEWLSPRGLAVVQLGQGPRAVASVCQLVGCSPVPGYEAVCEQVLTASLQPGTLVRVVPSGVAWKVGVAEGEAETVPILEAMAISGRTLSESLIGRGWAVPMVWEPHVRRRELIGELALARQQHQGVWAEAATVAESLAIPESMLRATAPTASTPGLLNAMGLVMVLGLFAALAVREARWRRRERPGILRRFGRSYLGLRPGLFRPLEASRRQDQADA